jgi:sporadic carbohydrate cluster 2OG-Fe(II) oxygenase
MSNLDNFIAKFTTHGFAIVDLDNLDFLDACNEKILQTFNVSNLEKLHSIINYDDLNSLRMKSFLEINSIPNWENLIYKAYKPYLDLLLGPDLAIQLKLNLSVQAPNDKNSILELHTDCLSGQSYYECVCWTPITRAFANNSMYIFNSNDTNTILSELNDNEFNGMDFLFNKFINKSIFVNLKPSQGLIFSSTLLHGNTLNTTDVTRVSINCRFKNLFSPEFDSFKTERKFGSFYKLFKLSPVTEFGLSSKERGIIFND